MERNVSCRAQGIAPGVGWAVAGRATAPGA